MPNEKKNIVILGAGFAGLSAAILLAKKIRKHPEYRVFLIDERADHVYTPDLYEIATSYNKKLNEECLTQLKDSVATPYANILGKLCDSECFQFIRDRVERVNPSQKTIALKKGGTVFFDTLALTLGSVTNYYNIPGLTQFSYPFKTLTDALAICCHLDIYFHTLWKSDKKKEVNIVIGGGGATGCELAAELPGYLDKICAKYGYPRTHAAITIIEGSGELTGQGQKVTEKILARFKKLGVRVALNTRIKNVSVNTIEVETKSASRAAWPHDILIWTGGVMPHPIIRQNFIDTAKNGALAVNQYLQSEKFPWVFAAGDNAFFIDAKTQKPVPMLAQSAVAQAPILAKNILAEIEGRPKKSYRPSIKGIIIPLGGKYAILKKGNFVFAGFLMWLLRRLVDLSYLLSILPLKQAITKWVHDTNVFVGNDRPSRSEATK